MAICSHCGGEMTEGISCLTDPVVIDGRAYAPIRWGQELRPGTATSPRNAATAGRRWAGSTTPVAAWSGARPVTARPSRATACPTARVRLRARPDRAGAGRTCCGASAGADRSRSPTSVRVPAAARGRTQATSSRCVVVRSRPLDLRVASHKGGWMTPATATRRNALSMGPLDGVRVLEAGLLVQGPQASLTMQEWGADVIKIELPGFGDQSSLASLGRGDRRSAFFTAYNRGKRSMTSTSGPERARRLPPPGRAGGRRDHQLQARDDGGVGSRLRRRGRPQPAHHLRHGLVVRAGGPGRGTRRSRSQRAGRRGVDQHDGRQRARTRARSAPPSPTTSRARTSWPASWPPCTRVERTGRGQLVETSLLGGQVWAQAGEYTRYLLSGEMSGPSGRSHPMIPGIYGVFPTADGWIAIVGTAGPARDLFYQTIGRPDLIERFHTLLYFEDDKAELWPILDEVFATKPTAEWCELLGAAGLRFAPVRDHAEVAADPGVRANGYITQRGGPRRLPGPSPRWSGRQCASRTQCRRPVLGPPSWDSTPRRCCSKPGTAGATSRTCRRRVPPKAVRSGRWRCVRVGRSIPASNSATHRIETTRSEHADETGDVPQGRRVRPSGQAS